MNLTQAIAIFWSRRRLTLAVFLACCAAAFTVAQLLKPEYTASAQIYINLSENGANSSAVVSPAVMRNYVVTQMEALRSRGTAAAVVEQLRLAEDPAIIAAYQAAAVEVDIREWLVGSLLNRLQVTRLRTSDIIQLSFRSPTPNGAADIANAFATAFLRLDVEMRAVPAQNLISWYADRISQTRSRMSEIERQRSLLRVEALGRGEFDASGAPDAAASLPTLLANARSAVVQTRAALDAARSGRNPPLENVEIVGLRRQLAETDLLLKRDLPRLGPTHQRIRTLQSNFEQLQTQIDVAIRRAQADLVSERERELGIAERRVADFEEQIKTEEGRRHLSVESRAGAVALDRELDSLRAQLETLVQRRERSSVDGAVMAGNMSILSRAIPPVNPTWPQIPLLMGLAAAFGLAFGLAIGFLREMIDRRVRCPDDLTSYLAIPVLGRVQGVRLSHAKAPLSNIPDPVLASSRFSRMPLLSRPQVVSE